MNQNFNKDVSDFFSSKKSYPTPDGILFYNFKDYTHYMKAYKNDLLVYTIEKDLKNALLQLRPEQSVYNELPTEEPREDTNRHCLIC